MKRKRKEKKKRSQQKKINKIKNPFNSNIRSEREREKVKRRIQTKLGVLMWYVTCVESIKQMTSSVQKRFHFFFSSLSLFFSYQESI